LTPMLKKIESLINSQRSLPRRLSNLENAIAEQKILSAKTLINTFDYSSDLPIAHYEFKVFSQWGDDGIIQYLVNRIDISNKTFVEFGVENYAESNTRFLLINNNWSGLVMDGSASNIEQIKQSDLYWKYDIKALNAFVSCENINELILSYGFAKNVGILSIDIDGNDYWIWEAITVIDPVIVIIEYNSIFGPDRPWTIPYRPDFDRTAAHYSNLYFGSSLLALCDLAEKKGYYFVGCTSSGNNAYFVRKDKIGPVRTQEPHIGFVLSKFRESRSADGGLTYVAGEERLAALKGMPVFNTRKLQTEFIE
jgi:hypothetical protein